METKIEDSRAGLAQAIWPRRSSHTAGELERPEKAASVAAP